MNILIKILSKILAVRLYLSDMDSGVTFPTLLDALRSPYGARGDVRRLGLFYSNKAYFDQHRTGTLTTVSGQDYKLCFFAACKA